MDASEIPDQTNAMRVAKLLGVDGRELVEALTSKTIFAQGDSVVINRYNLNIYIYISGPVFALRCKSRYKCPPNVM